MYLCVRVFFSFTDRASKWLMHRRNLFLQYSQLKRESWSFPASWEFGSTVPLLSFFSSELDLAPCTMCLELSGNSCPCPLIRTPPCSSPSEKKPPCTCTSMYVCFSLVAIREICVASFKCRNPHRSNTTFWHFFPLTGGCSEGLGAFRFFFKYQISLSLVL